MTLLYRLWYQFTLYLPTFLMGLLAMATYWLVHMTPIVTMPVLIAAPQHHSDYFMRQFSLRTYAGHLDGRLKSEVMGGDARHYPDTDTLEIDQVQIRFFDEDGHLSTATARQAITNSNASEVKLVGQAKVLRAATLDKQGHSQSALGISSEFLHVFLNTERVQSHQLVQLTRDLDRWTADSLDLDHLNRVMVLKGRVRGLLMPVAHRLP